MKILLASGSPRRRDLLRRLVPDFEFAASGVSEDISAPPTELVRLLAERKARALLANLKEGLVIGADTAIDLDGDEVGKPADPSDAGRILRRLRGRDHSVVTGIFVVDARTGRSRVSSVSTIVRMRNYSESEIRDYVASGEPMDKAGAYAIQGLGGEMVESIDGCYFNVIGLPLCEACRLLRFFGLEAPSEEACRLPGGEPCPRLIERSAKRREDVSHLSPRRD